jgi:hypothetical protein
MTSLYEHIVNHIETECEHIFAQCDDDAALDIHTEAINQAAYKIICTIQEMLTISPQPPTPEKNNKQ